MNSYEECEDSGLHSLIGIVITLLVVFVLEFL